MALYTGTNILTFLHFNTDNDIVIDIEIDIEIEIEVEIIIKENFKV
jgi:hypothetical protein